MRTPTATTMQDDDIASEPFYEVACPNCGETVTSARMIWMQAKQLRALRRDL